MIRSFAEKFFLIFVVVLVSACSSSLQQQYKDEAKAICGLYEPERWKNKEGSSVLDNFAKLNGEIRKAVKSEAFVEVFDRLSKTGYEDFYKALQPEVSRLIGEEWKCENAKNFYAIKWGRKVESTQSAVETDVVITVLDKSVLNIEDKKINYLDTNAMKSALQEIAASKRKIILKVPESHTKQELDKLLDPFKEVGVKKIRVVFY